MKWSDEVVMLFIKDGNKRRFLISKINAMLFVALSCMIMILTFEENKDGLMPIEVMPFNETAIFEMKVFTTSEGTMPLVDNKGKLGLGSNAELMMGMILLSGTSDASFLSGVLDLLNHDNFMPQAYSGIDLAKKHTSCPPQQHTHLYMDHLINRPNKPRYVAGKANRLERTNLYNANE